MINVMPMIVKCVFIIVGVIVKIRNAIRESMVVVAIIAMGGKNETRTCCICK